MTLLIALLLLHIAGIDNPEVIIGTVIMWVGHILYHD